MRAIAWKAQVRLCARYRKLMAAGKRQSLVTTAIAREMAAAIREGWRGPLFIQGDHFQTNPKKMKEGPEKEVAAIEAEVAKLTNP